MMVIIKMQDWNQDVLSKHVQQPEMLKHFTELGLPHRKMENWKYNRLSDMQAFNISDAEVTTQLSLQALTPYLADQMAHLVFVNGVVQDPVPEGVYLSPIVSEQLTQATQLFKQHYTQLKGQHPMVMLNLAMAQRANYIACDSQLKKPLQVLHIITQVDQQLLCPLNLFNLAGEVEIYEEVISLDDSKAIYNIVSHFGFQPQAKLNYYKIQKLDSEPFYFSNSLFAQQQDSELNAYYLSLGGKLAREDIHCLLTAKNASCNLYGAYLPYHAQQEIDFHTNIEHRVGETASSELFKGLVAHDAKAIFNGRVMIERNAQRAKTKQTNHNLLLSKHAEINAKPELEIYADDVECSHGATVGQLDEEALFYLRSRGITEREAQRILTEGFTEDVINHIPNADIANIFKQILAAHLEKLL